MRSSSTLLRRNFLLLWQGQLVSQLGSQAFIIASLFWTKRQTDSATLLGLVTLASTLPMVLLGPLGGTLADRVSRRRLMITADLVRGAGSLSLAALVLASPPATGLLFAYLLFTVALIGAGDAFFRPAVGAAIPDLVTAAEVPRANSLNRLTLDVATFFGQGLGGVLFRLLGPGVLFLADGLSYLVSALSLGFIHLPVRERAAAAAGGEPGGSAATVRRDLAVGLRYAVARPGLRLLLFLPPLESLFFITVVVLFPFYVEDTLSATPDWYGFLVAGFGAGSVAGSLTAGFTGLRGRRRAAAFLAATTVFALAVGGLAFARRPLVALVLVVTGGAMNGFTLIHVLSLLQLTTPPDLRGRVLGLFETLGLSMTPLAALLAGPVADLLDHDIPTVYLGAAAGLLAIAVFQVTSRELWGFLAQEGTAG